MTRNEQIRHTHAGLIVAVVAACGNPALLPALERELHAAEANGWTTLAVAIRKVLAGDRAATLLAGLDDEDSIIVEAILAGLRDPRTLPDPNAEADPVVAAPGLAALVDASRRGDAEAARWLAGMAEQMTAMEGDLRRMGAVLPRLAHGERDPDVLCRGMGAQGRTLVAAVLEELARLADQ